jgi:hypothetical protein
MFPITRVDQRQAQSVEPLGSKPKFWFSLGGPRLLFKAEDRGTGEDWAEKVACHLASLIGLPHVHYELAEEYDGQRYIRPGVVCETCAPRGRTLVLGNQLMLERDPGYPAHDHRKYKVREHTVDAVARVVGQLELPSGQWMTAAPPGMATALDVFAGYVLLDAWIANQDRHHENWAALRDDALRLAPTFDHGAALARNLTDEERQARLTTRDQGQSVRHFSGRARSAFYASATDKQPLRTIDALAAFAVHAVQAAQAWQARLAQVQPADTAAILDEVPPNRLSRISRDFTLQLLVENQRRILDMELR